MARPQGAHCKLRFGADLEAWRLRPVVHATLPFDRAGEAHRLLASREVFGKLVLTT